MLLKSHPNLFLIPGSRPGAPSGTTGFPHSSGGKESTFNAEDPGLIPGSGRSPGEGNGKPLQSSCLENPMTEELGVSRAGHDLATKRLLLRYQGRSQEENQTVVGRVKSWRTSHVMDQGT